MNVGLRIRRMPVRIAIPLPTSLDLAYNRLNWAAYAEAVARHGAEPVECALNLDDRELARLARSCQAVLLPGSPADVDPSCYGQVRDQATAPADTQRERTDIYLLQHMDTHRKPLLGVCFGAQILNVHRGGTLVQDLSVLPVNHSCARNVFVAHSVNVASGSLLAEVVDAAEAPWTNQYARLPVNSSHHQAIGIAGRGLKVCGRCPQDAVIEAVEGDPKGGPNFVLGLQWHPERTTESSATARAIFGRFVAEAEAWLDRSEKQS